MSKKNKAKKTQKTKFNCIIECSDGLKAQEMFVRLFTLTT